MLDRRTRLWNHLWREPSAQAEGHGKGLIETADLGRPQTAPAPGQHRLWQREEVVAIDCRVVVEPFLSPDWHLCHMPVEGAGDERAHHRGDDLDGGITGGDHDGMKSHGGDVGIPDVAPGYPSPLAARHAATEKALSLATSSSC